MNGNFPAITAFPVLTKLTQEFPQSKAYLVGGAVRDILLDKEVTDFDMLVTGIPSHELEAFLAKNGRVVFAGRNFGIWKFREIGKPPAEVYDIALPRTEFSMHKQGLYRDFTVKTDHRLPVVEDLKRRDFTVNAMAYDLAAQKLIDPHNGQRDLAQKIIKTVGSAAERFSEDYSRMLRAIRFSLQLGFEIEPETEKTLREMIPNINAFSENRRVVPYEIIAEELLKSLKANPPEAIRQWDRLGALTEIVPELLQMKGCVQPENWHTEGDVWPHVILALETLSSEAFRKEFGEHQPGMELIVAVLFHDIGKPYTITTPERDNSDRIRFNDHDVVGAKIAKRVLNRIRASAPPNVGINIDYVCWLVRYHMLLVHGDLEKMRPTTIEKYFFSTIYPSQDLIKLMFVDGLATVGPEGEGFTNNYERLKAKMGHIKQQTGSHGIKLAKPLISGNDVMNLLLIPAGRRVGTILEEIRLKQLSGELGSRADALEFLNQKKTSA